MIAIGLIALLFAALVDPYTPLSPDRSDEIVSGGTVVALLAALATAVYIIRAKPTLRRPIFVAIPLLSLAALVFGGLIGGAIIDRFYRYRDFSHQPVTGFNGFLRIRRAYIGHGKGVHYHVQLTDFTAAELNLSSTDYEAVFGKSEDVRPVDLCLRARLQKSGDALRMFTPSQRELPPNTFVHCPKRARLLTVG